MSSNNYRPDIDGLRAIAVILVVLYHAGLGFSGGFVGVDVFFVISGFLITQLILKEVAAKTFSLADFWIRRIRRIAPASLFMVLTCLVAGFFILFPEDFTSLAKSAIAHMAMLSNVYFYRKSGYFDQSSDLKPLLHTWSLGVEEQFYLVYPLVLVLLLRLNRLTAAIVLSALTMVSFVTSCWMVHSHPSGAFYLLPSRGWEMMLGGLICFAPRTFTLKSWTRNIVSALGIIAIVSTSLVYTSHTAFPGIAALLPCLGAAAIVYGNSTSLSFTGALLATRPLVHIGKISYSLYLWHWPLIVFFKYHYGDSLSLQTKLAIVGASFALAQISWKYIETPFRTSSSWRSRWHTVGAFAVSTCAVAMISYGIMRENGIPNRYRSELRHLFATMNESSHRISVSMEDLRSKQLPEFGDQNGTTSCLVWGDSHAMVLVQVLDEVCRESGVRGFQATHTGTLPLVDFTFDRKWAATPEFNDEVFNLVTQTKFDIIILAGYWSRDSDHPEFAGALQKTIAKIHATGGKVIVVRDVPDQQESARQLVANALREKTNLEDIGVTISEHTRQQQSANEAISGLSTPSVVILDPTPFLTDDRGRCRVVVDGNCLYSDNDHLTVAGARQLKSLFENVMQDATAQTEGKSTLR